MIRIEIPDAKRIIEIPESFQEMSQKITANQSADACMAGAQSVAVNIRFQSDRL